MVIVNDVEVEQLFYLKKGEWVSLNKQDGEFRSPKEIYKLVGSKKGFKTAFNEDVPPDLLQNKATPKKVVERANEMISNLENIEMDNLEKTADNLDNFGVDLRRAANDSEMSDALPMRELLGLDKALQRIQGELANNMGKLTDLDKHIGRENRKLEEVENDPAINDKEALKREIASRLDDLKEERSTRLELASQNKKEMQSQVARIRQTIEKVMDSDTSLAEKIKTIFREQGITIAAIVTAIGLIITTIVEAVLPGSTAAGAAGAAGGSSTADKAKDWIKKQLKNIANLLGKLAAKFGAALPGILGSIVTWLLTTMKNGALFLAEHLWLLVVGIVALVYSYINKKKIIL